ncbi:MAG TPA: DUF58 domain-containing protein [bacterium]|nr:DUF58 domain-containing protein [bacterium]
MRTIAIISRWVPVVLVVGFLPFVPIPVQIASFALVILHGTAALRGTHRLLRLAALTGVIIPPLIAESLWPNVLVALLTLPGLPWLEFSLRSTSDAALDEVWPLFWVTDQRYVTPQAVSLILSMLAVTLVGALTDHVSLVGSSALVLACVGGLAAISFTRIPLDSLTVQPSTVRVLARNTFETAVSLLPRMRVPAHILIELDDAWASVSPNRFVGKTVPVVVRVKVTPPLAGSKTLLGRTGSMDPWGLIVTAQQVQLAQVVVIPRATYAARLARAYLTQTAGGTDVLAALPQTQEATGTTQRGLDYYGARRYEPGDPLRDVFWKHTLKLRQLVVKERRGQQGEAVILAVNVWSSTADDLDQTAYNTVVSTLTLAREDVPIVFAAYTDEAIVSVTPVLSPRQAVLHALHLVGAMREVARPTRVLPPTQLVRLRRRVERLLASNASPAARLARVLQFEYRAHVGRAKQHPGYEAVLKAADHLLSSAALLVTSSGPNDPEAIELALERLRIRGVHALRVPLGSGVTVRKPEQAYQ